MSFKAFSIFSSSDHFVPFSKFGRGSPKEQICEIILKTVQWPRRRCCLKVFLLLTFVAILFSGAEF